MINLFNIGNFKKNICCEKKRGGGGGGSAPSDAMCLVNFNIKTKHSTTVCTEN